MRHWLAWDDPNTARIIRAGGDVGRGGDGFVGLLIVAHLFDQLDRNTAAQTTDVMAGPSPNSGQSPKMRERVK